MRIATVLLVVIALVGGGVGHSQELPLESPSSWFDANPTARSFGMGFTGMTTVGDGPSLLNPASLGLWAMTGTAYQMHNWERGGLGGGIQYDLSNTMEALGARFVPKNLERPPRFTFGVLHRTGRWRVGPTKRVGFLDEEYIATGVREVRNVGVSVGMDAGIDLALGFQTISEDGRREDYRPLATYAQVIEPGISAGYLVRLRLLHALHTWGFISTIPSRGGLTFDVVAAHGGSAGWYEGRGVSIGLVTHFENLPVFSTEYAHDYFYSIGSHGWELRMFGSIALRRGNQSFRWTNTNFYDAEGNSIGAPDWSTEGFAIDISSAQRWLRHSLEIETSTAVSWVLDRIDLRYETASFRNPDSAPPGLGDISIRQWTVGLSAPLR